MLSRSTPISSKRGLSSSSIPSSKIGYGFYAKVGSDYYFSPKRGSVGFYNLSERLIYPSRSSNP